MLDWKCYSTTDMVNWTDHGSIASLAIFPWAVQDNGAWAPQCIEPDGKSRGQSSFAAPRSADDVDAVRGWGPPIRRLAHVPSL